MKVNRIKALCKAEKRCIIYGSGEDGEMQRIGTTSAAYPAGDLGICESGVSTLFDWPDVQEDIEVSMMEFAESRLCPQEERTGRMTKFAESRLCPQEERTGRLTEMYVGFSINYLDEEVVPLSCEEGVYFILGKYRDAAEKMEGFERYFLARNAQGEPLILMSDGLLAPAIIKPIPEKTAREVCNYLAKIGEMQARGWAWEDEKIDDAQLPGQMNMDEMLEEE